jgi:hypothetical protein
VVDDDVREVLIKVHAASVNPADWQIRAGYLRGDSWAESTIHSDGIAGQWILPHGINPSDFSSRKFYDDHRIEPEWNRISKFQPSGFEMSEQGV